MNFVRMAVAGAALLVGFTVARYYNVEPDDHGPRVATGRPVAGA